MPLFAATLLFVGGHFLLSDRALRRPLLERLGENGFRGLYSLLMLAAFVWMLLSYRQAPFLPLWQPPPWSAYLPVLIMPFATILAVGGLTQPNPTAVGGERLIGEAGSRPAARGFLTVTRHPFLAGSALWALSHLLANGDAASLILMGGIAVLSLGGMVHIDRRRAAALGSAWGPIALTTSRLPFAAALTGRTRIDWAGIGWARPLAGLALYGLLAVAHPWLFGVAVLPT